MDSPQGIEIQQGESERDGFFTTVTPFSKHLSIVLFILLPFAGFWFGVTYAHDYSLKIKSQSLSNTEMASGGNNSIQGAATTTQHERSLRMHERVVDITSQAISLNDLKICNSILDSSAEGIAQSMLYLFDCYSKVGIAKRDLMICQQIPDLSFKGIVSYKAECAAGIAIATGQSSLCDGIAKEATREYIPVRDLCYMSVAETVNDPSICSLISTWPDKYGLNRYCTSQVQ